jgi:hypothetical protein
MPCRPQTPDLGRGYKFGHFYETLQAVGVYFELHGATVIGMCGRCEGMDEIFTRCMRCREVIGDAMQVKICKGKYPKPLQQVRNAGSKDKDFPLRAVNQEVNQVIQINMQ